MQGQWPDVLSDTVIVTSALISAIEAFSTYWLGEAILVHFLTQVISIQLTVLCYFSYQ